MGRSFWLSRKDQVQLKHRGGRLETEAFSKASESISLTRAVPGGGGSNVRRQGSWLGPDGEGSCWQVKDLGPSLKVGLRLSLNYFWNYSPEPSSAPPAPPGPRPTS